MVFGYENQGCADFTAFYKTEDDNPVIEYRLDDGKLLQKYDCWDEFEYAMNQKTDKDELYLFDKLIPEISLHLEDSTIAKIKLDFRDKRRAEFKRGKRRRE